MTFSKDIMLEKDFSCYQIWKDYYDQKMKTISGLPGINVIGEIGVRAGYGARMFIEGRDNIEAYIGFDCYDTEHHCGITNKELIDHANKIISDTGTYHRLVKVNTQEIDSLKSYFPYGVDFMHIDGDHKYESVLHDLEMTLEVLNPNGFILIDDIGKVDEHGKILFGAALVKHAADVFIDRNKLFVRQIDTLTGEYLVSREPYDGVL